MQTPRLWGVISCNQPQNSSATRDALTLGLAIGQSTVPNEIRSLGAVRAGLHPANGVVGQHDLEPAYGPCRVRLGLGHPISQGSWPPACHGVHAQLAGICWLQDRLRKLPAPVYFTNRYACRDSLALDRWCRRADDEAEAVAAVEGCDLLGSRLAGVVHHAQRLGLHCLPALDCVRRAATAGTDGVKSGNKTVSAICLPAGQLRQQFGLQRQIRGVPLSHRGRPLDPRP